MGREAIFNEITRYCRDSRLEGLQPDREPAGSGAGDAGATRARPTASQPGPLRQVAVAVAVAASCSSVESGIDLLPQDHRQHADGEGPLRHVQKLKPARAAETTSPRSGATRTARRSSKAGSEGPWYPDESRIRGRQVRSSKVLGAEAGEREQGRKERDSPECEDQGELRELELRSDTTRPKDECPMSLRQIREDSDRRVLLNYRTNARHRRDGVANEFNGN